MTTAPPTKSHMVWDQFTPTVMVMLHTDVAPSDEEWDAYMTHVQPLVPSKHKLLVLTDGGAPTAVQRKKVVEWIGKDSFPRAVVTDSRVARSAITILSWFDSAIHAFSPDELGSALRYVGISEGEAPACLALIKRLSTRLVTAEAFQQKFLSGVVFGARMAG